MRRKIIFLVIILMFSRISSFAQVPNSESDILLLYRSIADMESVQKYVYADKTKTPEERVNDLLQHLTFEEKLLLTGGWSGINVQGSFNIPGISRLGIRPVTMADASQGIRKIPFPSKEGISGTSFPSLLALTSTWNTDIARQYGIAIGEECRALGIDILLGPGMNFYRLPTGGRHFEYLGEDPFLATPVATEYIIGLQMNRNLSVTLRIVS
jgi:beta-glucosidase